MVLIVACGAKVGLLGLVLMVNRKGAIVRRIPDAALLRHSGVTAGFFSSLTWTLLDDTSTRRRVGPAPVTALPCRIDPRPFDWLLGCPALRVASPPVRRRLSYGPPWLASSYWLIGSLT
jgi:hypothetical protein